MARFYLHLYNRVGFVEDQEGQELPDLAAARAVAIKSIRDLVSEEAKRGRIDFGARIEIAGEEGVVAAVVPFSEGVALILEGAS
jgi:hypothetical protein